MAGNLEGLITQLGLGEYSSVLHGVAKPSIELIDSGDAITPGCSKFGGSPDVPVGFEWLRHDKGDYRFLGQMNLAEIPSTSFALPASGLLSFFYQHDDEGEAFWRDPDFVRVFHFESGDGLVNTPPPETVRFGDAVRIEFEPGVDVPPWDSEKMEQCALDESQEDAYWELRCQLHPSDRYLFGFPFNTTLAYDPTPGDGWMSLLTLNSSDRMGWCWHDEDWLVTFVEEHRLRVADFSEIRADAG